MSNAIVEFKNSVSKEEVPFVHITHKNCFDGTGAVLAIRSYCDSINIEYPRVQPMQYNEELNIDELADMNVLITDFSFSRDVLIELEHKCKNLFVIDHHATAENDLEDLDYCYFDMENSGAVLTWQIFMPLEKTPELLLYIEDRDLWNWKMPFSKEVSAGLNLYRKDDYYELHTGMESDDFIEKLMHKGFAIVAYQKNIIDSVNSKLDKGKVKLVTFEGYKVPMYNNSHLISEIRNMLTQEFPFSIQYFITDTEIVFSFRANGEVDLTKLNVPRGHPNAAGRGFKLEDVNLNMLFNDTIDIGAYLAEMIRLNDKIKTLGTVKLSDDENEYSVVIGKLSRNKFGTYIGDEAIAKLKTGVMYAEYGQPDIESLRGLSNKDLMVRIATVDTNNICAAINVKQIDVSDNEVKLIGTVTPTGPKKDLIANDTGLSFAYRGFERKDKYGAELINIITFDIVSSDIHINRNKFKVV